jgi:hypothetical protein
MILGWPPSKIVSGDPDFQPKLSDTFLKGTHPGTIPARFGLIWLSGFRGEDLNVIFYQNMPNLHNRYISAERKISQRGDEIKKKSSPLKLLSQPQPNFAEMILGWPPSKIVSGDPDFPSLCLYSSNLGTFWLKIEQFWPFEEISILSNSGHLEWRAGLSDTFLKGTHPGTIPARFGLIWFSGFRGENGRQAQNRKRGGEILIVHCCFSVSQNELKC